MTHPVRAQRIASQRLRNTKIDRDRKILQLWMQGVDSPTEISRMLPQMGEDAISPQRVSVILKRELDAIRARNITMLDGVLHGRIEQLGQIIRQAWAIVNAPCATCRGRGLTEVNSPNGNTLEVACIHCGGEGKRHDPDVRLKAMREIRAGVAEHARLIGDAGTRARPEDTPSDERRRAELSSLSGEELDARLKDFQAGVEAGVELEQRRRTRESA